jgi:hypothetical protein
MTPVRDGHTSRRSLTIRGLDQSGLQRDREHRASNEHLAVVVVTLIAAGCGMQAGWRDR